MKRPSPEKRQRAVALSYGANNAAPIVLASGAGHIAEKIIELARENNIPLKTDDTLASILSKLDVGFEIPPETYRAVADILAFLYRTDQQWRAKKEAQGVFPKKREETAVPAAQTRATVPSTTR